MPHWLLIAWMVLNLALVLGCLFVSRPMIFAEPPTEPVSETPEQESTENPEIPNFPQRVA